jgi:hypothetical protein
MTTANLSGSSVIGLEALGNELSVKVVENDDDDEDDVDDNDLASFE